MLINQFFNYNRKICAFFERYLPMEKGIYKPYDKTVAKYMNSNNGQKILDVGGGKSCSFIKYKNPNLDTKIVVVDISPEELKHNFGVDEKIVADITQKMPFNEEEFDLIVSRSVFEHLENLEDFIKNSKPLLKEKGHYIHVFPCRFALFGIFNQLFPEKIKNQLLYLLIPGSKGKSDFKAFYDKCYYSAIVSLLKKNNFEIVEIKISYYQSYYFNFFAPLYLLSVIYELIINYLDIKNLGAYILFVARKK